MEIYVESFIIQNILINLCLLRLVYLTTKTQTTFFKLIIASILGTIPSVIAVIFLNNQSLSNIIKCLTAILMVTCAFKQTKKQFTFNFILLFIYTFAFGGLITSFNSTTYSTPFGIVTSSKLSLEFVCISILVLTQVFELVVNHLKLKINTTALIYTLTITQSNKSIKINAYLDTGNFLNHNGEPVLILDLKAYLKLTNSNLIKFYTTHMQEINTATINGNDKLKMFTVDKIQIQQGKTKIELHNQHVAINTTNCFKNTNYQALLSPLFL